METKICTKCKIEQDIINFYKDLRRKDGLQSHCKKCCNKRSVEYNKIFRKNNPELVKEWGRKNSKDDYRRRKKAILKYQIEYNRKNKNKIRNRRREYYKERYQTDPLFRTRVLLSSRLWKASKGIGFTKTNKTENILGCSYKEFMAYIESKLQKGMTFFNQGQWHLDHIIPLSTAKTQEELEKLCHYTNLQPLWAKDNLSKSNKII